MLRSVRESEAASWVSLGRYGRKEAVGEVPLHQGGRYPLPWLRRDTLWGEEGPVFVALSGVTQSPSEVPLAFSLDPRDTGPVTQRTSISTL